MKTKGYCTPISLDFAQWKHFPQKLITFDAKIAYRIFTATPIAVEILE